MKYSRSLFWFRRDLRLVDNHGLFQALSLSDEVVPVFVFDVHILEDLTDRKDPRVTFMYKQVAQLKKQLEERGGTLHVLHGEPVSLILQKAAEMKAEVVFANEDYEPYAVMRDRNIEQGLNKANVAFQLYKDQVIKDPREVLKKDGTPYFVYTPYMKRWRQQFAEGELTAFPSGGTLLHDRIARQAPGFLPDIGQLGFAFSGRSVPEFDLSETFLRNYAQTRNLPTLPTSHLSVYLRFGVVSVREAYRKAWLLSDVFVNELIWREFYMMILWHFPHVVDLSFKPAYDLIDWRNNEEEFARWCQGCTGFPIVDAGMRQLLATGYMHNRVRMIASSFLVKDLLVDWRWGEAFFAEKLLDYELASNNGGWQWAAGSGCDAAPYFRIFNPQSQVQKFDPQLEYVRKWVPEFDSLTYDSPVVDHKYARLRALETYKKALRQNH